MSYGVYSLIMGSGSIYDLACFMATTRKDQWVQVYGDGYETWYKFVPASNKEVEALQDLPSAVVVRKVQ